MKKTLLFGSLLLSMSVSVAMPISLYAEEKAPFFLEVGKKYNMIYMGNVPFTVLDMGKDGWIKVKLENEERIVWINTKATLIIEPLEIVK